MTDPKLTKLRILSKRADKAYELAEKARIDAFTAYYAEAKKQGLCAACEKPLVECKCVWMA